MKDQSLNGNYFPRNSGHLCLFNDFAELKNISEETTSLAWFPFIIRGVDTNPNEAIYNFDGPQNPQLSMYRTALFMSLIPLIPSISDHHKPY